jgi:hypothetical protein
MKSVWRPLKSLGVPLLFAIAFVARANGQEAGVRISVPDGNECWVGQRVALVVELLAPGYFSGAATFEPADPPGMLLLPPNGSPVVGSEEINGVSYTVQRHELSAFIRRAGEQFIPAISVRFQFKRSPLSRDKEEVSLKTNAVRINAKLPPGAETSRGIISARDLQVEESWKPDPAAANLKLGSAMTRTITFTAPDVPAMAFPPFRPGAIEGLGIYQKEAEVLDHSERGALTGKRRETIVYVCQREGQFSVPAAKFIWWDLGLKELHTVLLPARTFTVAPNPALAAAAAPAAAHPTSCRAVWTGGLAAVAINLLACLFWRFQAVWARFIAVFRPIHLSSLNPESDDGHDPNESELPVIATAADSGDVKY